jgi:hypothetical protein
VVVGGCVMYIYNLLNIRKHIEWWSRHTPHTQAYLAVDGVPGQAHDGALVRPVHQLVAPVRPTLLALLLLALLLAAERLPAPGWIVAWQ